MNKVYALLLVALAVTSNLDASYAPRIVWTGKDPTGQLARTAITLADNTVPTVPDAVTVVILDDNSGIILFVPLGMTVEIPTTTKVTISQRAESGWIRFDVQPKPHLQIEFRKTTPTVLPETLLAVGFCGSAYHRRLMQSAPQGIGAQFAWMSGDHVFDIGALPPVCNARCPDCFLVDLQRRKTDELSLDELLRVVDQLAELEGNPVRCINILGAGEPTLFPEMLTPLLYRFKEVGIYPVVFTNGNTPFCRDSELLNCLYQETDVTWSPKMDSPYNRRFQNATFGAAEDTQWFDRRNAFVQLLADVGYNRLDPELGTRILFDFVVRPQTLHEVEPFLRYCREQNMAVLFTTPLPSGGSKKAFQKGLLITKEQHEWMTRLIQEVDASYGYHHPLWRNFATTACRESGLLSHTGEFYFCPGRIESVGNIRLQPLADLIRVLYERRPERCPATYDGQCLCRTYWA